MADGSKIEWTDATWNPITGCTVISPGCTNCYAMKLAGGRMKNHPSRQGLTIATKNGAVWNGMLRFNEQWLDQPLRWSAPRQIFVCAHGDLFHEEVPDEWIDKIFAVMALCPQHTFQVLTKRPERMRRYITRLVNDETGNALEELCDAAVQVTQSPCAAHVEDVNLPLPNVWLGVSCENQECADERVPILLDTPGAVRWVSAEPLLGPINFHEYLLGFPGGYPAGCVCGHGHGFNRCPNYGGVSRRCHKCGCESFQKSPGSDGLHWIVVGGESGPKARPMHPDWARSIRDQCASAGVAFHFKQWGAWSEFYDRDRDDPDWRRCPKLEGQMRRGGERYVNLAGGFGFHGERVVAMRHVDKAAAGRLLDGVEHNGYPLRMAFPPTTTGGAAMK